MKRISKYSLFCFFLVWAMATNCQENSDAVPEELKPFIKAVKEPCVFKEIPDFVKTEPAGFITKAQAHEDVEMLQYLFDNAYSGRYYWEQNGFDYDNYYQTLHEFIDESSSTDTVDVKELENSIYNNLYPINDGHTAIVGFSFHGCYRSVKPYYAEIILEKQEDTYLVKESNQLGVETGMEYNDSTRFLFKTLSKRGTEQYLLGTLSMENLDTISLKFNSHIKTLQLHPSRLSDIEVDRESIVVEIDTINTIPIVRSSSFNWGKEKVQYLEEFVNYGNELKDKPLFIWNLAGNWGGDASFPYQFIRNFNGICQDQSYGLVLHSPAVNQCYWKGKNNWLEWPDIYKRALNDDNFPLDSIPERKREKIRLIREDKKMMIDKPVKYWEIKMKPEKQYGDYNGKAIILVNNQTGSASNDAIAGSKSVPSAILIGENTAPSYSIGNMKFYQLEHSRIVLWIPGNLGIHADNNMEKGFFPDYWLDSNAPIDEIMNWVQKPDDYQFTYKK